MNQKTIVSSFALALGLAACGGTESGDPATSQAIAQELDGTWDFALEESDVAARFRARCNGDAACWSGVLRDASTEKIRFTTAGGQTVWTSFAREGDKEHIFVEVPLSVARAEPNVVVARAAGWPRGTIVGQATRLRATMRIERRADGTIAIVDPDKGRLVYRHAVSTEL